MLAELLYFERGCSVLLAPLSIMKCCGSKKFSVAGGKIWDYDEVKIHMGVLRPKAAGIVLRTLFEGV